MTDAKGSANDNKCVASAIAMDSLSISVIAPIIVIVIAIVIVEPLASLILTRELFGQWFVWGVWGAMDAIHYVLHYVFH